MKVQHQIVLAIILFAYIRMAISHKKYKECHPYCGRTPDSGQCKKGRCLCMWTMTGPFSRYIKKGKKKGRIEAAFCEWKCDYSKKEQNPKCVDNYGIEEGNSSGSDSDSDDCEDYELMG
ncbi:uncharacterized protein LOC135681759 [Rhopilema esculentum]|uniref:uncharacterized protein LOC135681759 n=1 Tax=Rhopilema esculentum TaxID=499914 RepID=UPI0031DCC88B